MSEEEANRLYEEVENEPECDLRKFVADVRAGRVRLSSWDMAISFDEFARRVDAGEYD